MDRVTASPVPWLTTGGPRVVSQLPATGTPGEIIFHSRTLRIYYWTGAKWQRIQNG